MRRFSRRKLFIFFSFLLSIAAAAVYFLLRPQSAQAAWFDDTYTYRVRASFVHNADIAAERAVTYTLDNTELITASILQSDCDDIRFTDANGKLLKHDLTSTCDNASATYKVIFASIANGTNVFYAYYGNAAAPNVEVNSASYTALTPSGGDPTAQSAPTSNDEQGPGPISYWNFDEAQGSTANDYSTGSNNDLTITNALWKTTDLCIIGNCLYFDGNADRASKSYSADTELLPGTGSFTVSAWFKHDSTAGSDTMLSRVDAVNGIGWKVYMDSSGFMCFGIDAVAGTFPNDDTCTASSFADSQWHYVTAVKNNTTNIQIYIDAKIQDTQTGITSATLDGTNAGFRVGNDFDEGTNGWSGFIDEVKYFNFAKSASQIVTEFNLRGSVKGVAAQFGQPSNEFLNKGLAGYWKMDESSGNAADSSGNNMTGTATGTTVVTGQFGNARSFTSTDQIAVSSISNVYSVAFWIKPTSTTTDIIRLSTSPTTNISASSGIVSGTGITTPGVYVNGVLNGTLTTNVWQHVTVTSTTAITADGILLGRISTALAGSLDDVRMYNRALSPAEVSALYSFAPGPVGWWKMDENTGTSSTADSSGYGGGGTMSSFTASSWVQGKFGSALTFNGSNTDVNVGTASQYNTISPLSVSMWVKPTGSTSNRLIGKRSGGAGWYLGTVGLNRDLAFYVEYNTTDLQAQLTSDPLTLDLWNHIAITWDGSTTASNVKFYVNGIQYTGDTLTNGDATRADDSANAIVIGERTDGAEPYNGIMDDVRIYNYARTPKQIIEDMNAGHPAGGSPIGSQVVYWKFDEGQGTTANNSGSASSSNGNVSGASPATATSGWNVTGKVNKGIIFDGTDDYVSILTASDAAVDFNASEQFTLTSWVYSTSVPATTTDEDLIIGKWDETSSLRAYRMFLENDDTDTTGHIRVEVMDESTVGNEILSAQSANDTIEPNTWYHVALTFNGTITGAADSLKVYINGRERGTNSANTSFLGIDDVASDFTVGDYDITDSTATLDAFTGKIDEVKVYGGLLTQSEVLVDMNAGSSIALGGVLGTQDNEGFGGNPPVGWWKFDDTSGNAVDSSGNDFTLTNVNSTPYSSGKIGKSGLLTKSSSQYLWRDSMGATVLQPNNTHSWSIWVNIRSFPTFTTNIVREGSLGSGEAYRLRMGSTTLSTNLEGDASCGTGVTVNSVSHGFSLNTWYHLAWVIDGTNSILYKDGVQIDSDAFSGTVCTPTGGNDEFYVGYFENAGDYWDGNLDNLKMFDYALSPAQVAYDYNRGAPIAWYKFDECQGATAYNASVLGSGAAAGDNGTIRFGSLGNTATGSCSSGTSTEMWNDGTNGKFNSGLGFDGSDDYVDMGDVSEFKSITSMSAEAWVTTDTLSGGEDNLRYVLGKEGDNAAATEVILRMDTANDRFEFYMGGSGYVGATSGTKVTIATGTWYHLMGVYDGSNVHLYVNGILVDSQAHSGATGTTTQALRIGNNHRTSFPNERHWSGLIDNVKLYSYPLTATQVKRAYNEGSAQRFGPASGSP